MFNIIFIHCKVSRTNDFSCILRVLQKADFEIYKLFLFLVVKYILADIREPRLQRSAKEITQNEHIKGSAEGFSDVCKYKFSQMNNIEIHKSVSPAVFNRYICRKIIVTGTTEYLYTCSCPLVLNLSLFLTLVSCSDHIWCRYDHILKISVAGLCFGCYSTVYT